MVLDWLHDSTTILVLFVVLLWQCINSVKFLNILQLHKYCITIRRYFYLFKNPLPFFIHFFSSATNSLLINFCDTIFLNDRFDYHAISFQWLNVCFHRARFNFSLCFMFLSILIGLFVIDAEIVLFVLFVIILIIFKQHFGFFL